MRVKESLATFVVCLLACAACLSTNVRAQQSATQQPAAQTQREEPPAKKNERPAAEAAQGDPFDKAAVEQLSKQCVALETDSGSIRIELLDEAAPESVFNLLNLAASVAFDMTSFSRFANGYVI